MNLTKEQQAELHSLQKGGQLRTEDVVRLAKDPASALHSHPLFEWDVNKAAETQWLNAARKIIEVYVVVIKDHNESKPMRGYVHVTTSENGPTYLPTEQMLQQNRAQLVNIVCDRILSAIKNYSLQEFDSVITLVERIRQQAGEAKCSTAKLSEAKPS